MTHLWEVDHPYYCEESNWYSTDAHIRYDSWAEFYANWVHHDDDLNHLFRWDWDHTEADEDGPATTSRLFLGMMLQRKGKYVPIEIYGMTPEDEPQVREYLERHWATVEKLWAPISEVT